MLFAEAQNVIQIGAVESAVFLLIAVLGAGSAWGSLKSSVKNIDEDVDDIKKDFKRFEKEFRGFEKEFTAVKTLVENQAQAKYAQSNSPKRLTPAGKKVLVDSGIKEVVDKNKEELIAMVRKSNPTNAYDVEICSVQAVKKYLPKNDKLMNEVKDNTFALGEVLPIVLFVGGLYLRNIVLPEFGYSLDDIDKDDPQKKLGKGKK